MTSMDIWTVIEHFPTNAALVAVLLSAVGDMVMLGLICVAGSYLDYRCASPWHREDQVGRSRTQMLTPPNQEGR